MPKEIQLAHGSTFGDNWTPAVFVQLGGTTGIVSVEDAIRFGAGVIGSAQKALLEYRVLAWLRDKFGNLLPDEKILATFEQFRDFAPVVSDTPNR